VLKRDVKLQLTNRGYVSGPLGIPEWEFLGIYVPCNYQREFPGILKIFKIVTFFWILVGPYYVKLCFDEQH